MEAHESQFPHSVYTRTAASGLATPTTSYDPAPATAPRNATLNTTDQATIGKSLVIKGEVTGSESLYIDGRVEGSINLPEIASP